MGKEFHVHQYAELGVVHVEEYLLPQYHFLQNQNQSGVLSRVQTWFLG